MYLTIFMIIQRCTVVHRSFNMMFLFYLISGLSCIGVLLPTYGILLNKIILKACFPDQMKIQEKDKVDMYE